MEQKDRRSSIEGIPPFDRDLFAGRGAIARIGGGDAGAKAERLAAIRRVLEETIAPRFLPDLHVSVPPTVIVTTDCFDLFMERNDLYRRAESDAGDDAIADAFRASAVPPRLVDELSRFLSVTGAPLAVRSSGTIEPAVGRPLPRLHATRMIPNRQADPAARLGDLLDAIRFVYGSTFFRRAKEYLRAAGRPPADARMAVIVQEVVGSSYGPRFYPHISGVMRSCNFYPFGLARPEEGVVRLALGLGRTIMEDGAAWSYSPAHPNVNPPHKSVHDLLDRTQREFWAIDMTVRPDGHAGGAESLVRCGLSDAERDGALGLVASTYRVQDDRIVPGVEAEGPRIVDFAPVLKYESIPLTRLLRRLLEVCEERLGGMVEVEFAVALCGRSAAPARFGLLQLRPMSETEAVVDVPPGELRREDVLLASESVLGNGASDALRDIVYVRPDRYRPEHTEAIAHELEILNGELIALGRPYILIGFGRWGTTDPRCGIPVTFGQIRGTHVLVEATHPEMPVMPSQAAHFFQDVVDHRVVLFSVERSDRDRIDWDWLARQDVERETPFVRRVASRSPLAVRVDGRAGRGVIRHG
jgi:hypothetical protein